MAQRMASAHAEVVPTTVTDEADIGDWPAIVPVLGDAFAAIRPAATALVCGLVDPRMKIEIEVTARMQNARPR